MNGRSAVPGSSPRTIERRSIGRDVDGIRDFRCKSKRRQLDLQREPRTIRDVYGANRMGQSCLLARRLVEAGVPFVTVEDFDWDHHGGILRLCENRCPNWIRRSRRCSTICTTRPTGNDAGGTADRLRSNARRQ